MKSSYASPVGQNQFSFIGLVSLALGLVLTAMYFVFQMKAASADSAKKSVPNRMMWEIVYGLGASLCLGVAVLFLCLEFGLWI